MREAESYWIALRGPGSAGDADARAPDERPRADGEHGGIGRGVPHALDVPAADDREPADLDADVGAGQHADASHERGVGQTRPGRRHDGVGEVEVDAADERDDGGARAQGEAPRAAEAAER